MKKEITKDLLDDLYIKQNISTREIARILGCSKETIANRCREYGLALKGPRKNKERIDKQTGITKEMLEDLYIKQNISTHKISRILGCSSETIANRCREYGITLKGPGKKKEKIDKETLVRLYVKEGKNLKEISEIIGCSYSRTRNYCLEYGIQIRHENNTLEGYSEKHSSGNGKIQQMYQFPKTA